MRRDRFGEVIEPAQGGDATASWLELHPEHRDALEREARGTLGLRAGAEHGSRVAALALEMTVQRLARRAMFAETIGSDHEHGCDD